MKEKIKKILSSEKNRNRLFMILGVTLFLSLATIVTYAWFTATLTGDDAQKGVTVKTGELSIEYNSGPRFKVENIMPGWSDEKTFTVTNTGDGEVTYNINWAELTNTFETKPDFVYSISSTNTGGVLSETQVPNSGEHVSIISNITIAEGATQTYTINFKYINRNESQNEDQGASVAGKIEVLDINTTPQRSFASILKTNNPPTAYTTVPGRVAATTDEGLIEGPNDDYGNKTYYFRGATPDNYVSFADETWRIIRINGDGSIRLILDGTAGESVWNTKYQSTTWSTALSYAAYGNSTIKGNVETWYNTNIGNNSDYSSKVVTTKYCNDKTYTTGSQYYFGAANRLFLNESAEEANPSFVCPTDTSEGNDIYNLNVGLLTADEVAFAGGKIYNPNKKYYLYNSTISNSWWTISLNTWFVSGGSIYAWCVIASNDFFGSNYLGNVISVRPVISLSSNVAVTTASPTNPGTSANPYIVQ